MIRRPSRQQCRRGLLRAAVTLAASLAFGAGYSFLHGGDHLPLFWHLCWPAAVKAVLPLILVQIWLDRMLHAPRLSTRLILWGLLTALLFPGAAVMLLSPRVPAVLETAGSFSLLLPAAALCLPAALLLWVTRRLLAPLDIIQTALTECSAQGRCSPIALSGMPHTQLYEISSILNQLFADAATRSNALRSEKAAYARLVPDGLPRLFGHTDAAALKAGDSASLHAVLLTVFPMDPEPGAAEDPLEHAAEIIGIHGGLLLGRDIGSGALTALFFSSDAALECAGQCACTCETVMSAVLETHVTARLLGNDDRLIPLIQAPSMARCLAVLTLLRQFGARVVRCGTGGAGMRLLGWDRGTAFYEETVWRTPAWHLAWREAEALWEQALTLYRQCAFAPAMRKFAGVLRAMPGDPAARWYLLRCDVLRGTDGSQANTDLLCG